MKRWMRREVRRPLVLAFAILLVFIIAGAAYTYHVSCGIVIDMPDSGPHRATEVWLLYEDGSLSTSYPPIIVLNKPGTHEILVPPGRYHFRVCQYDTPLCYCGFKGILTDTELCVTPWHKSHVNARDEYDAGVKESLTKRNSP